MKFLRSIGLAVLLMVGASEAFAAPSVLDDSSGAAFGYRISFRADTADSERMVVTPVQCSVGVAHSGTGTVSLYQVATSATAASSGTLVATFTASTTTPTTFSPGLPFLKAVASVASDGTLMTIRCSNTQITKTDGVDVLIGGEDGVADAANPNTSPIICPKANAACHYLSTTTGWWAATASNGESTTTWAATQEFNLTPLLVLQGNAASSRAAYDAAQCLGFSYPYVLNTSTCAWEGNMYVLPFDVQLTRMSVTTVNGDISGDDSCDIKMTTTDGTVNVTGAELSMPDADGVTRNIGYTASAVLTATLSAGTPFQFQARDGTFSQSPTGGGLCDGGVGHIKIDVFGVRAS